MHRIAIDFSRRADVPATFFLDDPVNSGRAVDLLLDCARVCTETAADMETGRSAAEPERLRLMFANAEVCRAAAHVMILGVPHHRELCEACVSLCEACAAACGDDAEAGECAATCRACAEACRNVVVH
ncbi:four-helix bundle copper-binding protein [Xanthobacter sp. KR7-225]|uniref:four-helix bundle copper-binding protein n=1 Tax=Xanthobacter sp. KR7-225 TaxID=3156613 RepID=UPI0032B4DD2E